MFNFFLKLWQSILSKLSAIKYTIKTWFPFFFSKPDEPSSQPNVSSIVKEGKISTHEVPEDQKKFMELTSHIYELLGLLVMSHREEYQVGFDYVKKHGNFSDFILDISTEKPALIAAIRSVFHDLYECQIEKYWVVMCLNTQKLPKEHPLWTPEGRLSAFHQLYDRLVEYTLVMGGRLGQHRSDFCQQHPDFSPAQVENLLKMHFNQHRQKFMDSTNIVEKRKILADIVNSYTSIRTDFSLFSKIVINQACQLKLVTKHLLGQHELPIVRQAIEEYVIGATPVGAR